MNALKVPFFTILFIFLFLFLYIKFAGPIPFFINSVQTTKTDLFHVSGEGKVTGVPDTGVVDFAVTKSASTIADAQNQTNTAVTSVTRALQRLNIPDKSIKTTNYSVEPQYANPDLTQTIKGYTVTQSVEVQVKPIGQLNGVIDAITANGANVVGDVSFTFADDTQKKLTDQARMDAIKDAKDKAQGLANAAGIHLGRIVDVQEENASPVRTVGFGAVSADSKSVGTPTQVTPGENTVSSTVTLSYETY